jgi:2,3-bisphosphoglycerate-independent phosphoglycerate mutase
VTETDPAETGKRMLKAKPLNDTAEAKRTAGLLNEITVKFHGVLQDHPLNKERAKQGLAVANVVLCRGAGTVPKIKPLSDVYGIKVACVAAVPLVKGVCMLAGMKMLHVKGATGTLDTDYFAKSKAAVQALKDHDLVVLHVKATDIASHDRKPKLKAEVIEKIDAMLGSVLDKIDMDSTYVAVTADHTTSVVTGRHEGEPVPIAITGQYVRRDDVMEYGERTCARGGLGRIRGMELMPILMNLLGKTKQFGA